MSGERHILERLYEILLERKSADPEESYVASLYKKGEDKILEKVGEEAVETILAHKSGRRDEIVCETADLLFHTLVALADKGIDPAEVFAELDRRFGVTGHRHKR